ncbi:hypothetical protein Ddc_22658 [Ditylenchus destructor]|nr:hypothetical protein Ddc_22658 [Ditylenchus destructor]
MPKKGVLQKLNPKSKGKVQKSKAQKSMTLVATSAMLAEREYTYEQNMVVHTLDQGIDRNMIKTEEIKLEAEAVEGEDINQFSTNSVRITSEKLIKNEPELVATNPNDNAVEFSDEVHRNLTEISNIEAELSSGTLSNNVSSHDEMQRETGSDIDIDDEQESDQSTDSILNGNNALNVDDTEEANART